MITLHPLAAITSLLLGGASLVLAEALSEPAVAAGKDIFGSSNSSSVVAEHFHSARLNADVQFLAYLPENYGSDRAQTYPVVYLLHGRGDSMHAWLEAKSELDRLIHNRRIPPVIAIIPDAPFSRRASYYVDSRFTGDRSLPPGQPVETVFTTELIAAIDTRYPTIASRSGRVVAGYSMGGYGALRFALTHPDLFSRAIVLSPAVYVPLPPSSSSTREFGAFGRGEAVFDEEVYQTKNYPSLLPAFERSAMPLKMFIAVGDLEAALPNPAESVHDLDYEAHTLYNRLRRVPGVSVRFRVVGGGHDWVTWRPTFSEGLEYVFGPGSLRSQTPR